MYLLFESPAGYALFQCDESKASTPDAINSILATPQKSFPMKLKAFSKFESTSEAMEDTIMLVEGTMPESLKKFLKKEVKKNTQLGVSDMKLAKAITKKLSIPIVSDISVVNEWTRGARSILPSLLISEGNQNTASSMDGSMFNPAAKDILGVMALGLAHSLSRFKLKFSSDRIDSMVIQAIALLDDLDKELNTYAMRLREWYGWHFPELTSVLTDSIAYARLIQSTGRREQIITDDLSALLPEDLEAKIKALANLSMGTELTDSDLDHIKRLADEVVSLSQYRTELSEYLRSRMQAVAPNLTALVGELVGARLISHSGSLMGLAKSPASTLQLLGAEKALFRALKTRSPTPKYGLLFHSSMVGQANPRHKGKIARVLAAKASLSVRIDALARTEEESSSAYSDGSFGQASRIKVEQRLRAIEKSSSVTSGIGSKKYSFVSPPQESSSQVINAISQYDMSTDAVFGMSSKRPLVEEVSMCPEISELPISSKRQKNSRVEKTEPSKNSKSRQKEVDKKEPVKSEKKDKKVEKTDLKEVGKKDKKSKKENK